MKWKYLWMGLLILALAGIFGFTIWASAASGPSTTALIALQSDAKVRVTVGTDQITFSPLYTNPQTGLVFYPGGKVDFRSYSPLLHAVAAQGYEVVVVRMPLNLAVFGVERAAQVMADDPKIKNWAIGGHSLGGSMAASFAFSHPDLVQGLVLWASYPASNNSLANRHIRVVSIFGTRDGLATPAKIDQSRAYLPGDTEWVTIDGGNHAQFGSYGLQQGDNPAQVPASVQWDQTVAATVNLLKSLGN
jgi:pimeloyl-ACP methyl ester carboxylesterase